MKGSSIANTLRISFAIKNTYNVNSIIYGLKQIPLIRKIIPESIYGNSALKVVVNVIAFIMEIIKSFAGKFVYIFGMIFLLSSLYGKVDQAAVYLHIIFLLTFIGAMLNTFIFNPSKPDYYAIVLMRMDAREYVMVKYGYELAKLMIGFMAFGCIFGGIAGIPWYINLIIPFFVIAAKMTYSAIALGDCEKNNLTAGEGTLDKLKWLLILLLLAAAYGLPAAGIVIPDIAVYICAAVIIIAGVFSVKKIWTFRWYRVVYGRMLNNLNAQMDANNANLERYSARSAIAIDSSDQNEKLESKKGYRYLNALFTSRHRKILWKPIKSVTVICTVVVIAGIGIVYFFPAGRAGITKIILEGMPLSAFWMYMINRGNSYTQALFMNCDHSLLTYRFYRRPKDVLGLFAIRLRESIKINIIPAAILGAGMAVILCVAGASIPALTYVLVVVTIIAESVFFSVHYLVIYYLLQPYNAGTEIKSGMYKVITVVTYIVCYMLINVQMNVVKYGCIATGFAVAYCLIGCILVYRIAPRTFKIRP